MNRTWKNCWTLIVGALVAATGIEVRGTDAKTTPESRWVWHEFSTDISAWSLPDGSMAWYSGGNGGRILVLKRDELETLPVPADAKLEGLVVSVTRDSENAWIFSTNILGVDQSRTDLIRVDGKTRESFADRDDLVSKMAHKGASYRVGSPLNPWYPVFDDRGRSVSSHAGQFVKLYDGKSWRTSPQVPEGSLHGRHPFFRDGKVIVVGLLGTYAGAIDPETDQWTWQSTAPVAYPFPEPIQTHPVRSIPADDPALGTFWGVPLQVGLFTVVMGKEKLGVHDGRIWHAVPTAATPIAAWRSISHATLTQPNKFIFRSGDPAGRTAILIVPPIRLTTNNPRLGSFDKPHGVARPDIESDLPAEARLLYYRINHGKWDPLPADGKVKLGIQPNGIHQLTVCAVAKEKLSVSVRLTFEFETTYDFGEHIGPMVRQLGADEHAVREEATRTLIEYGEVVVPVMTRLLDHDDPEVVARAKQIIQAVTRPSQ